MKRTFLFLAVFAMVAFPGNISVAQAPKAPTADLNILPVVGPQLTRDRCEVPVETQYIFWYTEKIKSECRWHSAVAFIAYLNCPDDEDIGILYVAPADENKEVRWYDVNEDGTENWDRTDAYYITGAIHFLLMM